MANNEDHYDDTEAFFWAYGTVIGLLIAMYFVVSTTLLVCSREHRRLHPSAARQEAGALELV